MNYIKYKCPYYPCEKKFDFYTQKKEKTICSLFEVENFLCNLNKAGKFIHLYKFLK